jgi:hypothetical protein
MNVGGHSRAERAVSRFEIRKLRILDAKHLHEL